MRAELNLSPRASGCVDLDLAIVSPELWERVQAIKSGKSSTYQRQSGGEFAATRGHPSYQHRAAIFSPCS